MLAVKPESSFTPSKLNKKTTAGFKALDRKFIQISKETKEDLFINELKVDYFVDPDVRQIKISDIFSPPAFTRHNSSNPLEDLEALDNPDPVKVVRAEGVKGFFIISGQRRLEFHKRNEKKKKQINAIIVGQVVCRSQIAMARALDMTRFKRQPNALELVVGLLSLYEIIINEFGKEAFFSHGGNRKGEKKKDKQSLSQYIVTVLGLKQSTVNALLNFGLYVGPYGLAGLQYHEDMQRLAIRTINQINAKLKKEKLSKKLSVMFHSLDDAKSSEADRIKACGNLAHQIISGHIAALNEGHNEDEKGEDFEPFDLDPSAYDLPPKRDKQPQGPEANGKNANDNSGDNTAEKDDEETNIEDEIKEALKILKRIKYLVPRFEKELRCVNQLEKTRQINLYKDLMKFNADAENMISFAKKIIADLTLGN
jgi:hypothetical protein